MTTFRQQLRVFSDQNLSPAALSGLLAKTARKAVADLIAEGRASPHYTRYVDGREGMPEEAVSPRGRIHYEFSYVGEAAAFALQFLRQWAPVATGEFRDSFFFSVNGGAAIPARMFDARRVPPGAEIIISNYEPYNRKIDTNQAGNHRLRYSRPAGMYDATAKAVQRQFGVMIEAKRIYSVNFPGQRTLRRGPKAGSRVQSPAIVIRGVN